MREGRTYASGNLRGDESTEAFLCAFRDIVLPAFEWTDYVAGTRARAVPTSHVELVLHPLVLAMWEREQSTPVHTLEDRVYLDTGAPFNAVNRSRERKRREGEMRGYEKQAPVDLSRRLYSLMHWLHPKTFEPLLKRLDAAREAADTLQSEPARQAARSAVDAVADEPMQRYRFSAYSVRLWGDNPGVATVATPVRRALLSRCYELDLASSQLALAARDWDCPRLLAFLERGESIWRTLVPHIGLKWGDAAKAAVKSATYGLTFGAGEQRIIGDLTGEYRKATGAGVPAPERFCTTIRPERLSATSCI